MSYKRRFELCKDDILIAWGKATKERYPGLKKRAKQTGRDEMLNMAHMIFSDGKDKIRKDELPIEKIKHNE